MTASLSELELLAPPSQRLEEKRRLPVLPVHALLQSQHTLTAVERFAKTHEACGIPAGAKLYRELIPLERPRPGEQYAFEVDLDACTGCKACVAACHSLNGLDPNELWRTVGLLVGGTPAQAVVQTVTTSCHHCLEPACLEGCPVRAYEKDPVTGIVKHLDDQCFGCGYCTLMCPYDAPKYNERRGIVRKCDMCSDRLAHGEAPACVSACPNEAIAIRIVDQTSVVQRCDAKSFLPGAPAPDQTLPTTIYKTDRAVPVNLLPADFHVTRPEHSHLPLVVMLTLTQLSVGAFVVNLLLERLHSSHGNPIAQAAFACAFALVALAASVLHLGRPWLAWRAVLGLRTSWLSREAVAFGAFALLAVIYALIRAEAPLAAIGVESWGLRAASGLQSMAAFAGLVGVFCSAMVYVATRREHWSEERTFVSFFGTTLALGAALVLAVDAFAPSHPAFDDRSAGALVFVVSAVTCLKLAFDAAMLRKIRDKKQSALKRVATVMLQDLRRSTGLRFAAAAFAGVLLPLFFWHASLGATGLRVWSMLLVVTLGVAEFAERYQFFRAAPASRMPGGIR